jgi:hypothetical protein
MFSKTHLPVIRQPATRVATGALAALILAAVAQPASADDTASRVGPEPHWSSRIGTGQPFVTGFERQQSRTAFTASLDDASASAHWSARIGTGRAATESRSTPDVSPIAGVAPPPPHWSAGIGSGQASPGTDVRKLAERKVPAEAPAITERLGEHPAALVAQSWSTRGIDPNAFIVRHPAGPIWVNAPTATENATPVTVVSAIRTASAANE